MFFKSTNGCNGTAQSIAFTSLVWVPVEKYYEHTKTWHVPKAPTRHWQPVTQSVLPFVPEKKPTTQREGLHQWFANLRGTCPSTWVRKCYHVPVFPVQMSGAQVCSLPIRITGLWNPLFRLPRSWDANQGLRGHAMVSCTRAFVGVHPLWQGLWSTGERVDEWWWMFSFWVSEMFQFWYILIICIFAILGTLVWLFVSGCWRLGTGLHHGCGSYPGDPARNCFNV